MAFSFAIGVPVSYLFVSQWLKGFAYHLDLSGWMFIIPMLVLFGITTLIVCAQSFKTAMADPVKSLSMNKHKPPLLALRFLAWFCPPSLYESIEGDLLEQFEEDVQNLDVTRAKRKLLWNVIKFFRLGILLRNKFSTNTNRQFYAIQLL